MEWLKESPRMPIPATPTGLKPARRKRGAETDEHSTMTLEKRNARYSSDVRLSVIGIRPLLDVVVINA